MPTGSKTSYSSKQRRQARHIEVGYEKKGVSSKRAARIAWSTVNKETGGAQGPAAKRKKLARKSKSKIAGLVTSSKQVRT